MMEALTRGIARAAGVEVPPDVAIVEPATPRPTLLSRAVRAFRLWHIRRSTYRTLQQLDDRILKDIGLHRGTLDGVADAMGRRALGEAPVPSPRTVANDNDPATSRACG